MTPDYTGQHGGLLAMAFAAGCVACFAFCSVVGKFMWTILGKAKDDEITRLKAAIDDDRQQCRDMEVRLTQRIQYLEGILLMVAPGHMRQQIQTALSEQRIETDRLKQGSTE